jgi:hypothetical protein
MTFQAFRNPKAEIRRKAKARNPNLANPEGIVSLSPGLRGTSYPGFRYREGHQPCKGWITAQTDSLSRSAALSVAKNKFAALCRDAATAAHEYRIPI